MVGRHRRSRQVDRHGPLVRGRSEHDRRMPGLDRSGVCFARRSRVGRPRSRFVTIRDQVVAQVAFSDAIGIDRWAAVIGGSMGGMQALEWAVGYPDRVERVGDPRRARAQQRRPDRAQLRADRRHPARSAGSLGGDYYGATDGEVHIAGSPSPGGWRCSTIARPPNSTTVSSAAGRAVSARSAAADATRVESYLDFHGNKFTRRFDANSYITLVNAMNSHDIGRDRGGVASALGASDREGARTRHRLRSPVSRRAPATDRKPAYHRRSTAVTSWSSNRRSGTTGF